MSCRFTTGAFGLPAADRRHMTPPRIDTIRTLGRPGFARMSTPFPY
jgi:hypothetical protein